MKKFVILPDVTCDLGDELRKMYDIEYVHGHMTYPDGTEQVTYLDWSGYERLGENACDAFYADLKKNPTKYTTSPASIDEFAAEFEKYVEMGYGVLSMSISANLSGTYNFAVKAREQVLEKYPDAEIYCLDSSRFSVGYGLLAIHAAEQRSEGKTLAQTVEYLEQNKNRFHQAGWLDDLSFVAAKGRLTHAKAFFGKLIGIKPLGEFDYNGLTTVIGKAKGEKAAYEVLLNYIEATIENPQQQIILVAQTGRKKQALAYKEMIEQRFHPKAVYVCDVFPGCGINVGPGLMAAYYVGKPISQDLEEEKALMNKLLIK